MRPWYREPAVWSLVGLIALGLGLMWLGGSSARAHAACSEFADVQVSEVPVRCLKELMR